MPVSCQLLCSVTLLLVSFSITDSGLEQGTVSGSFTAPAGYSYPLDTEAADSDEYECGFPWGRKNSSGNCTCGVSLHDSVYCVMNKSGELSSTTVGILDCSCMTWDDTHNTTVVGHCFFNCENGSASDNSRINRVYHPVNGPTLHISPSNLTKAVCGHLNRDGRLCGKCASGHFPPAYSYDLKCVSCPNKWYNWFIFAAEAFGPLTIFLFVVLFFRIRATSAKLSAYVFFCQNFSIPSNVQVMLAGTSRNHVVLFLTKFFVTIYSIWNLDFFRSLYPPVCLHIDSMQLILLEYSIAFYPLLLLFFVYFAAKARSQIRGIGFVWPAPLQATMSSLSRTWNFRASVIHSFATFIVLSYGKLISISFHSLRFITVHNPYGHIKGVYVYSDPTIEFFGPEHKFYGLLSILVMLVFVVSPVVFMFVYPMKWFQRVLTKLRLNNEVLRSFMESFQGCYKDGTNNTRDCRYFSGIYLLVRIVFFFLYSITLTSLFYTFATILFIVMAILIITIRPYKERYKIYNKVDAVMILIQALSTSSILCHIFADIKGEQFRAFSEFLIAIFTILPMVYIVAVVVYWVYKNKALQRLCVAGARRRRLESSLGRGVRGEKEELVSGSQNSYGSIN